MWRERLIWPMLVPYFFFSNAQLQLAIFICNFSVAFSWVKSRLDSHTANLIRALKRSNFREGSQLLLACISFFFWANLRYSLLYLTIEIERKMNLIKSECWLRHKNPLVLSRCEFSMVIAERRCNRFTDVSYTIQSETNGIICVYYRICNKCVIITLWQI